MHTGLRPILGSALIVALALAGCGGSGSQSQSSTTQAASATQTASPTTTTTSSTSTSSEKVPNVNLPLASPVKLDPISARYTCDGANVSPPISWSQIPASTAEIDLFLFNLAPVHGKLFADWAVAGLKPTLHQLSAGRLPPGAIVGRNSLGQTRYSLCPPKGPGLHYAFLLYALPKRIPVKPGFDAEKLREKALHTAESAGLLGLSYTRR